MTTTQSTSLVSDDAVDAAMKAAPDQHISLGHWEPAISRSDMRRTLEAAAPSIIAAAAGDRIAAAWRAGYGAGRDDEADGRPVRDYADTATSRQAGHT
jgi:hypothetical protein